MNGLRQRKELNHIQLFFLQAQAGCTSYITILRTESQYYSCLPPPPPKKMTVEIHSWESAGKYFLTDLAPVAFVFPTHGTGCILPALGPLECFPELELVACFSGL